jgi:uncharacterized ParB-like nuclease family protein
MVATATKSKKSRAKDAGKPAAPAKIETLDHARRSRLWVRIPIARIAVDDSPNRLEDPTAANVEELARSMAIHGLQQPIGVEAIEANGQDYRLVFGRRRLEAAKLLGWEDIDASVMYTESEADLMVLRGIENMQRKELSPVDEALVVAHVIDIYEAQAALGPTAEPPQGEQPNLQLPVAQQVEARRQAVRKAAEYFGKPEQWIRDRMYLARFGPKERELVATGRLPLLHAREIAKVADPEQRAHLADAAAAGDPKGDDYFREFPLGIDELRELVSQRLLSLHQVPWSLTVPFAGQPACVECPHNSANNPGLFESGEPEFALTLESSKSRYGDRGHKEPKAGVCTNKGCFASKAAATKRAVKSAGHRVAKAVKELPKKERPKDLALSSVAKLGVEVPAFIDRFQVVEAAREAMKPARKDEAVKVEPYRFQEDPKLKARRELGDALMARAKKLEPALAAAMAKVPGAWAMYQIFRDHPLVRKLEAYNAKPEKILPGAEFRGLLKLVTEPSLEHLVALEKGCHRKFGLFHSHADGGSGLAEAVCEAFGIDVEAELGPRPTVADFMPRATKIERDPEAAPSELARAGGIAPAKKPGKKRPATGYDGPVGDQDEQLD